MLYRLESGKISFRNSLSAMLGVVFASVVLVNDAYARGGGITGASGAGTSTCADANCHTPRAGAVPVVTFGGTQSVTAGSTVEISLTITGGPAVSAGLDVSASGGTLALSANSSGIKVSAREITHSSGTTFTAGGVTYKFNWTAPMTAGSYTLYGSGFSGNGTGRGGDDFQNVTYPMTVTAAAAGGGGNTATTLTANIAGPATGTVNQALNFDGSGSTTPTGTTIASAGYVWDFGDNTTGTGAMVSHAYTAASNYTVSLTVTNSAGSTNTITKSVTINAAAAGGGGATTPPPTVGSPRIGQRLYDKYCSECHGPSGLGIEGDAPAILGATADQIAFEITDVPEMNTPELLALEEEELRLIAAYLQGAQLYIDNCESCHGVAGSGLNADGTPAPEPAILGVSSRDIAAAIRNEPEMQLDNLLALTREDRSLIAFFIPRKTRTSIGALRADSFSTDFTGTQSDKATDYPELFGVDANARTTTKKGSLDWLALTVLGAWAIRRRRRH